MSDIKIYRGSNYTNPGNWWSPRLGKAEMYRYGPLAGKVSKSKVSLENFRKGVERANTAHKVKRRILEKNYPLEYKSDDLGEFSKKPRGSKALPSAVKLRKQFDLDYKNMPLDKFKNKYYEAILPNQPSKISWTNTLKPLGLSPARVGMSALKQGAKFAGPLAIPLTVYDYISGSPAGKGSDNVKDAKPFDGKLKKKKR
jgi:hypothetical protein|tara:strand:- start:5 stop:601 length:597 start_codon:yes stop_codon:yes gene_type:complete